MAARSNGIIHKRFGFYYLWKLIVHGGYLGECSRLRGRLFHCRPFSARHPKSKRSNPSTRPTGLPHGKPASHNPPLCATSRPVLFLSTREQWVGLGRRLCHLAVALYNLVICVCQKTILQCGRSLRLKIVREFETKMQKMVRWEFVYISADHGRVPDAANHFKNV